MDGNSLRLRARLVGKLKFRMSSTARLHTYCVRLDGLASTYTGQSEGLAELDLDLS
jgi:hypothetical protein